MKHSTQRFAGGLKKAAQSAFWSGVHAYKSSSNFTGIPRLASFPFISCDTYRSISTVVIDRDFKSDDLQNVKLGPGHEVIYIELSFLKDRGGEGPLLDWITTSDFSSVSIVLHNHCWVPAPNYLSQLVAAGAQVFSVHINDGVPGVTPIPVGIENAIRRKNGVLDDFHLYQDLARRPFASDTERTDMIFGAFKTSTNPHGREPLARALTQSRHGFSSSRLSVTDFRRRVLKSHFVASPPGKGPDSYRTWESIYLGAVPIVLRGTLAKSLSDNLPIWVVDDWEEALTASDDALVERYHLTKQAPTEKAFFSFWNSAIAEPRQENR